MTTSKGGAPKGSVPGNKGKPKPAEQKRDASIRGEGQARADEKNAAGVRVAKYHGNQR